METDGEQGNRGNKGGQRLVSQSVSELLPHFSNDGANRDTRVDNVQSSLATLEWGDRGTGGRRVDMAYLFQSDGYILVKPRMYGSVFLPTQGSTTV